MSQAIAPAVSFIIIACVIVIVLARHCYRLQQRLSSKIETIDMLHKIIRAQHELITERETWAQAPPERARYTVSLGPFTLPLPPAPTASRNYYTDHGRN